MASPVQARSLDKRARLLDAGRVAFAERGHDAVNLTADILEPAGVSVGSFYHQFADKTELLIAILDDAAVARKARVLTRPAPAGAGQSLEADLIEIVERLFASLDDDGHLWRIQLRERTNADPRIRQRILAGRRAWRDELVQYFEPYHHGDPRALAEAVELVPLTYCVGLIATYLDLPDAERRARRRRWPAAVSDLLYRAMKPLLDDQHPKSGTAR